MSKKREPYVLPLEALRDKGILLMINMLVFHPRGAALGVILDDNDRVIGFQVFGDGTEPWHYKDEPEHDAKWRAFNKMLNEAMTSNLIGD